MYIYKIDKRYKKYEAVHFFHDEGHIKAVCLNILCAFILVGVAFHNQSFVCHSDLFPLHAGSGLSFLWF